MTVRPPEVKTVDLGGGWSATIRRPELETQIAWEELRDGPLRNTDPEPELGEHGRDAPPATPPAQPQRGSWADLMVFARRRLFPETVLSFQDPAGISLALADTALADLGQVRTSRLIASIWEFTREADAWFRDDSQPALG